METLKTVSDVYMYIRHIMHRKFEKTQFESTMDILVSILGKLVELDPNAPANGILSEKEIVAHGNTITEHYIKCLYFICLVYPPDNLPVYLDLANEFHEVMELKKDEFKKIESAYIIMGADPYTIENIRISKNNNQFLETSVSMAKRKILSCIASPASPCADISVLESYRIINSFYVLIRNMNRIKDLISSDEPNVLDIVLSKTEKEFDELIMSRLDNIKLNC